MCVDMLFFISVVVYKVIIHDFVLMAVIHNSLQVLSVRHTYGFPCRQDTITYMILELQFFQETVLTVYRMPRDTRMYSNFCLFLFINKASIK